MKKFLFAFLTIVVFASCSKQSDLPQNIIEPTGSNIFFKDDNLAISSITATNTSENKVQVKFSTMYEKNIVKLELMSGDNANYLCAIHTESLSSNSTQTKNYTIVDNNPKGAIVYYMIRYSLANGDWGYTNLFKFQRGN